MEFIPDPIVEEPTTKNIERDTRILIAFNGIGNILLGIAILFFANTAAESVLDRFLPQHLWPMMWLFTGISGLIGIRSRFIARFSFIMCGIVYAVFAIAGVYAIVVEGKYAAIVTTTFLVYVWGLLWGISTLIRQRNVIVREVAVTTEKAADALERVTTGYQNGGSTEDKA